MTSTERPSPLAALAHVARLADDMDDVVSRLVEEARRGDPPATWADIGGALGITRQAAYHRYGRPTSEAESAPPQ